MTKKVFFGPRVAIQLKAPYKNIAPFFAKITMGYFAPEGKDPSDTFSEKITESCLQALKKKTLPDLSGQGDVSRLAWVWTYDIPPVILIRAFPNRRIERADAISDDVTRRYLFELQQKAIVALLQKLDECKIEYVILKNGD